MPGGGPGEPEDDVTRLREAFGSLSAVARPGADCPDSERLWAAARGELPVRARRELVDHTSTCPACAEAWRLARELAGEAEPAAEPWAGRFSAFLGLRPSWNLAGLAVAAALVLAVGITAYHLGSVSGPVTPEYREPNRTPIRSLLPAEGSVPREKLVLRWSPSPAGSRYHLTVTTEGLKPVAEAYDLDAAELAIPTERLAGIPPGTKLYWQVEARLPDGVRMRSDTFTVQLQ